MVIEHNSRHYWWTLPVDISVDIPANIPADILTDIPKDSGGYTGGDHVRRCLLICPLVCPPVIEHNRLAEKPADIPTDTGGQPVETISVGVCWNVRRCPLVCPPLSSDMSSSVRW